MVGLRLAFTTALLNTRSVMAGEGAISQGGGGDPLLNYAFTFNGEAFTFGGVAFTYGAP